MRTFVRRTVGLVMALAMVVNTACYAFVPAVQGVAPKAGDYVKVRLTAEGTTELARFLGPRVEWAEGTLSAIHPDGAIVVGVQQITLVDGLVHFWTGEGLVTVPAGQVAEVQRRALDKRRTRIASIAFVLGMVAIAGIAFGGGGAHGLPDAGSVPPPP